MSQAAACDWMVLSMCSWPVPEPGQISQVRCQASGVEMFEGQNGQVRHCMGREW